jgi:transglutaminase-like putative cysteine protease
VLLGFLVTAVPAPAGAAESPHEDWYALELGGQRAGWAVEREERRGDEIVSELTLRLELRRGTTVVSVELESRFVETRGGRPLRASVVQRLGALPVEATYRFTEDGVVVGQEEAIEPLPAGDWLTPARLRRRIREEVAAGAEDFSLRTVDPQLGLEPITLRWVLEARGEEVTAGGATRRTSRWRHTTSAQPQLASVVHLDAEGRTVRSATSLLGMDVVQVLCTRAEALGRPLEAPELLRPTTFVPHDDPGVRELLARAWRRGEPAGDAARAERLRAFVAGYVTEKDLDTGLGTAAEVAATRSGDCTEHAVLLGALLRAAGVPSRGVFGLIYADDFAGDSAIFGYHMWTQALVDGRWIDLDATLDAPFDAAHVALGTWSFEDGAGVRELGRLAELMGRLRIRVLETGH